MTYDARLRRKIDILGKDEVRIKKDEVADQPRAAALARTFLAHSVRKTFISARNVAMRGPTANLCQK